jgi:hypothetical protein
MISGYLRASRCAAATGFANTFPPRRTRQSQIPLKNSRFRRVDSKKALFTGKTRRQIGYESNKP